MTILASLSRGEPCHMVCCSFGFFLQLFGDLPLRQSPGSDGWSPNDLRWCLAIGLGCRGYRQAAREVSLQTDAPLGRESQVTLCRTLSLALTSDLKCVHLECFTPPCRAHREAPFPLFWSHFSGRILDTCPRALSCSLVCQGFPPCFYWPFGVKDKFS